MTLKTLLCFDYGSKRIGVAVGQVITSTATPLKTIHCYRNKPDWTLIQKLIDDWKPDALIVGIPLHMDDSRQDMTDAAEKFSRQLEGRFHIPVYGMDERLSTFEAKDRSGKISEIDSIAAQSILETWFAENNDKIS